MEDLLEIIKTRRSIRNYTDQIIDHSDLVDLVEAARWAPSAGNLQPLELIIVRDKDNKYDLSEAAGRQDFLFDCDTVFVMGVNIPRTASKYKERGERLYCLQDVAAATQNVMLLAWSKGIGSCWVGAFNEGEVSKICELPEYVRPTIMIALGYADTTQNVMVRPRRSKDEFVHQESW